MLDQHRSYHHAGRLCTGSGCLVVMLLAVFLLVLVPREMVAQPHPPVALVQAVERRPETIDGNCLYLGLNLICLSVLTPKGTFFC